MLRKIYYKLHPNGRRLIRRLYFLPIDIWIALSGKRRQLVPPKGLSFVGSGDFVKIGNKFFNHINTTCKIRTDSKILDIGCGIGRIAKPYTTYLTKDGEYRGFDILNCGINWCNNKYEKYPNFNFDYFPMKNDLYNLSTKEQASSFVFPYSVGTYDLALLVSVFTHMQKEEVENYFSEIGKVLKPEGYCYATFFLTEKSKTSEMFPFAFDDYCLHNLKVKDANVAYNKDYIYKIAKQNSLEVAQEHIGWWHSDKKNQEVDYQDIIIFKKTDTC